MAVGGVIAVKQVTIIDIFHFSFFISTLVCLSGVPVHQHLPRDLQVNLYCSASNHGIAAATGIVSESLAVAAFAAPVALFFVNSI